MLFRQEESDIRRKVIEADVIECVLGLGPNLFYNSPMEACIVICRSAKPKAHKGKILFINAVEEVTRERAQSFLTDDHIERVVTAYKKFKDERCFTRVSTLDQIRAKDCSLSIPLYVEAATTNGRLATKETNSLVGALNGWIESRGQFAEALAKILPKSQPPKLEPFFRGSDTCELIKGRGKWTRVRFGDLVENLNETESNPAEAGIERFIGLEHLQPGSLHVLTWGNVADGTTFTRRCRPGQVLFGKRRAYQRKVVVAEFDAVVSGDIYVLAPKNDRLVSGLLPFLCLSERFFQHAVGTSAGSLSPRTNWSSLASFEFDLPPLDEQQRIAEILWAMEEAIEASRSQHDVLAALKLAALNQRTVFGKTKFPVRMLGEVSTCQYGLSCALSVTGAYPILRMMNYDEELVAASELKFVNLPTETAADYMLEPGDILFNRTNSADLVGKVGIFQLDGCYLFASYLVRIKTNRTVLLPEFLNFYLNSAAGQTTVRAFATPGVSQSNISAGSLKKVYVPVPPLAEQMRVVREISEIAAMKRTAKRHLESQEALLQELTNALLV